MILVVNCLIEEALVDDFSQALDRELGALNQQHRCVRASELAAIDEDAFSHLIVSGSEASTTCRQPWEESLERVVQRFVASGKPLLGICYGHQFLAKVLAGPDHVRRAATPEFGWVAPALNASPLLEGLQAPTFMVCHFDEVHHLPVHFRILGSSPDCAVQAFQYKDLPVYGVQFHPEYGLAEAQKCFQAVARHGTYCITAPPADHSVLDQRRRIFENFVKLRQVRISSLAEAEQACLSACGGGRGV
jgi:GMP synthase-like glutamine amidotransferase